MLAWTTIKIKQLSHNSKHFKVLNSTSLITRGLWKRCSYIVVTIFASNLHGKQHQKIWELYVRRRWGLTRHTNRSAMQDNRTATLQTLQTINATNRLNKFQTTVKQLLNTLRTILKIKQLWNNSKHFKSLNTLNTSNISSWEPYEVACVVPVDVLSSMPHISRSIWYFFEASRTRFRAVAGQYESGCAAWPFIRFFSFHAGIEVFRRLSKVWLSRCPGQGGYPLSSMTDLVPRSALRSWR